VSFIDETLRPYFFLLHIGVVNASNSIDNIVTCPKERRRELDRARRAAMSPKQKVQINKRRCELYAAKNATRKLQMTPQEKKLKRKEINKKYNMTVREH
jgi:adenylosuccinate lyase